jgi:hypothetical protein
LTAQLECDLDASACKDHAWITALAVAFSARYLSALDRYDAADPSLEASWRMAFDKARRPSTSVFDNLVFGMTAHIVADLPHALVAVGLTEPSGRTRIADYHAVNDILGNAIDPISRHVGHRYAFPLFALERYANREGQVLTNFGIRMARAVAWYNAVRLEDPEVREIAAQSIQKSAVGIITQFANPPIWSVRMLLLLSRRVLSWFRRWPESPLEVEELAKSIAATTAATRQPWR